VKKVLVVILGVIAGLVAVPGGFVGAEDDPIACIHLHLQRRSACVYSIPRVPLP
jgi:hypothetical protein